MERLKLDSKTLLSPQEFQERFESIDRLLKGDGLHMDDLEIYKNFMLSPQIDLRTYIWILANNDKLQIEESVTLEGRPDGLIIRYMDGTRLLSQLEKEIKLKAASAQLALAKRKINPY